MIENSDRSHTKTTLPTGVFIFVGCNLTSVRIQYSSINCAGVAQLLERFLAKEEVES